MKSDWIEAKKQLPPDGKRVLVACPSGYRGTEFEYRTAYREEQHRPGQWLTPAGNSLLEEGLEPTHWCEEPSMPPKAAVEDAGERYYDEQILPLLSQVAERCIEQGFSFISVTEWQPGKAGVAVSMSSQPSFGMQMILAAANCKGDVDQFVLSVLQQAAAVGHQSLLFQRIPVPSDAEKH